MRNDSCLHNYRRKGRPQFRNQISATPGDKTNKLAICVQRNLDSRMNSISATRSVDIKGPTVSQWLLRLAVCKAYLCLRWPQIQNFWFCQGTGQGDSFRTQEMSIHIYIHLQAYPKPWIVYTLSLYLPLSLATDSGDSAVETCPIELKPHTGDSK